MNASVNTTIEPSAGVVLPPNRPLSLLRLGLLCGLASGFVDAACWYVRRYIFDAWIPVGDVVFWMSPFTQAAILVLVTLALVLVVHRWPKLRRAAYATQLFIASLYVSLLLPIHVLAGCLLSLGVGVQLSRLATSSSVRTRKLVDHTNWLLGIGLVLVFSIVQLVPMFQEWNAVANLPAAPVDAPNVLLVVVDTVSQEVFDVSRYPHAADVARRGVGFTNAYSTSPWTAPSHISMFTGRWRHELCGDLFTRPWRDDYPTLAEWLKKHGYVTAGFVGNTYYCSKLNRFSRGFDHYEDYPVSVGTLAKHNRLFDRFNQSSLSVRLGWFDRFGRVSASSVNSRFLRWYGDGKRRPYFAFLNYFDAHDPYVPPKEYRSDALRSFENRKLIRYWWNRRKEDLTPEQIQIARTAYVNCIRYIDSEIGRLFSELDQRGGLENTIIILTSDHGEHFGEHGLFGHANSLYQPLVHVPFYISWSGHIPADVTSEKIVSNRDIAATVADLTGLSADSPLPGASLHRYWDPAVETHTDEPILTSVLDMTHVPPNHGFSPTATAPLHAVVQDGMKLIVNAEGDEQLFNIADDPGETNNLVSDRTYQKDLERLRELLPEFVD